jgi:hypothetical protein
VFTLRSRVDRAAHARAFIVCVNFVRSKKNVCLVDLTGQNRQLPGLVQKNNLPSIDEHQELDVALPWKVGFSETSGNRNKCVDFNESLYT